MCTPGRGIIAPEMRTAASKHHPRAALMRAPACAVDPEHACFKMLCLREKINANVKTTQICLYFDVFAQSQSLLPHVWQLSKHF
jgi:hypothetical protein